VKCTKTDTVKQIFAFCARGSTFFCRRSRAQRQAGVLRSVQRSTASAATTRNASQGARACICFQRSAYTARSATQRAALHSAQCYTARSAALRWALHSAQRFTAPSASLRKALHSAQHCTPPPPLQRCTARSITQRPALHCTEHSEPRQGRSQQANQAYTSGGIFQSAFNGCCAQTVRVRVSLANSRTRALLFFRGSLTACDMDLCILEVLHTTML
jgi:hypothetical protein